MEDLTDEQVQELILQYYPENPDEVRAAFDQLKNELQLNNYETVVLIQKQMMADKQAMGGDTGRFQQLLGRIRG